MAVEHVFTGVPVADRDAAVAWYERLVGKPPDLIPNEHEAAWRLTPTSWVYIVADPERAGSAFNTVLVSDLDSFLADMKDRGIAAGAVETIGRSVRQTIIADPDGNRLKVGQPMA